MNSRNYDNVPPVANNTVTITTSSAAPPQVRIASNAQLRPLAVPMRSQPVPIRKIVHDPSTSNPQFTIRNEIKHEPEDDYQASTSSGPLIASTSTSGPANFQQYQRGSLLATSGALTPSSTLPSTSSGPLNGGGGVAGSSAMAMDQPAPINLASKVAEVFLTAGHAFQKLGDLTLQLHTTTDADESKWSEKEVDNLKNALTRFAHELDQISSCVASRTTKHIKNDIKRRHLMNEETSNQNMKRVSSGATGGANNYTTMGSGPSGTALLGSTVPLQQKRTVMQPIGKMVTRTMIPTTRYTVAPISGSSASLLNLQNSTVVVSSGTSSGPMTSSSPSGMPQLQSAVQSSQGSSGGGGVGGAHRVLVSNPRMPPTKLVGAAGAAGAMKRVMTPSSGALVLEQHD